MTNLCAAWIMASAGVMLPGGGVAGMLAGAGALATSFNEGNGKILSSIDGLAGFGGMGKMIGCWC